MFGYVIVNKPELKIKDYDKYHSYYCGLCHALHKKFGRAGQLTLSYDMTFLNVLLSGLYDTDGEGDATEEESMHTCIMHPTKKQLRTDSDFASYCADMNILLSYYNLQDDWYDSRDIKSRTAAMLLQKYIPELEEEYPRQNYAIRKYIAKLHTVEDLEETNIDLASGLTGEMLGEIFSMKDDEHAASLRKLGFFLGKFIYLMDAYEDRESDKESGNYNVFNLQEVEMQDEEIIQILQMMMSECALAFEALPIIKNVEILRNIIYSGVWTKLKMMHEEK